MGALPTSASDMMTTCRSAAGRGRSGLPGGVRVHAEATAMSWISALAKRRSGSISRRSGTFAAQRAGWPGLLVARHLAELLAELPLDQEIFVVM